MTEIPELRKITANPNWDQFVAIGPDRWDRVEDVIKQAIDRGIPKPFTSPCGDGSIHVSWRLGGGLKIIAEFFFPNVSDNRVWITVAHYRAEGHCGREYIQFDNDTQLLTFLELAREMGVLIDLQVRALTDDERTFDIVKSIVNGDMGRWVNG